MLLFSSTVRIPFRELKDHREMAGGNRWQRGIPFRELKAPSAIAPIEVLMESRLGS